MKPVVKNEEPNIFIVLKIYSFSLRDKGTRRMKMKWFNENDKKKHQKQNKQLTDMNA